jgi:hypothetical protein
MIRVQFKRFGDADPMPTWLDADVRAVSAEPFAFVDAGQGGITQGDIDDQTLIAPLSTFPVGAEVYVESEDVSDVLDDTDTTTERDTHIWWRATILGEGGQP